MLVLHYTGMRTAQEAIDRLRDPAAKVSAHYVVDEDGSVLQLVEEGMRAWHAGVSCWRGLRNVNAASIGIEIVNPGHEFGYRAFPPAQMEALVALCDGILARHPGIAPRDVVGHSDVAPLRKEDPGELFDWRALATQCIGLWPEVIQADERATAALRREWNLPPMLQEGNDHNGVTLLRRDLAAWGYDLPPEGAFDATLAATIRAFQRHWRPRRIDGRWDDACAARLDALLKFPSP